MSDTLQQLRFAAPRGPFGGADIFLLEPGRLVRQGPAGEKVLPFEAIAGISWLTARSGPDRMILRSRDGTRMVLREGAGADRSRLAPFARTLLQRIGDAGLRVPCAHGPGRIAWIAGWIGLAVSLLILVAAAVALAGGQGPGALALPVGIAAVNLAVVFPVVRGGAPRNISIDALIRLLDRP